MAASRSSEERSLLGAEAEGSVRSLGPEMESDESVGLGFVVGGARQHRQPLRKAAAAGALALGAGCAVAYVARSTVAPSRSGSTFVSNLRASAQANEEFGPVRLCGPTEEDVDFVYVGNWYDHIDHVVSIGDCCDMCKREPRCDGFTWVKDAKLKQGNPGQCWLKSGNMTGKNPKKGVISGFREARPDKRHELAAAQHHAAQQSRSGGRDEGDGDDEEEEEDVDVDVEGESAGGSQPKHHKPKGPVCAKAGESCLKAQCCEEPGSQCFTKDAYWAQCMNSCIAGPNPLDQVSPMPWECKALGPKADGEAKVCAKGEEDCSAAGCCEEAGKQCFEKNSTFAQCKDHCEPGADLRAADWLPWTCTPIGPRTLGAAPWVAEKCARGGADCSKSRCCADPGNQCYLQSQFWGECKSECKPGAPTYPGGPVWECTPVGTRTPAVASNDAAGGGKGQVGPWVEPRCAKLGEDCSKSQCCQEVDTQCYMKTGDWGTCKSACDADKPDPYDNKTWACEARGPRSWGLSTKGYPSLFCITLYMPSHYEGPLLKSHVEANVGIFQCDGYELFAAENDTLGTSKDGILVQPVQIPKIEVGVSQDGTAGNAKLFMAVWDKVIAGNRWRYYDWTIKVDPDAVIIPWRVRTHMKPHVGKSVYVVNCNKFPGSPNFPMMFGAVEIFSHAAMGAYAQGSWKCGTKLPWGSWGEDYYMTHCLDFLGVGRINDFGVLGDNVCTGANCLDTFVASFHPFKDKGSWFKCWTQATDPAALR